jgi:hypothetical protein
MKEAKEVNWADLRQFAEALGTKGFKPDRDLNELVLRLDLVTVKIYIDRKAKGDFKQIRGYILANFVDFGTSGIERTFEIKPFKGLSTIYVDECISAAQNIQTTFRAAFSAAANQTGLIDPKAIIAREKGGSK